MISLKKYLDSPQTGVTKNDREQGTTDAILKTYGSALLEMGNCSVDICPGLGEGLKRHLSVLKAGLSVDMDRAAIETNGQQVRERLKEWGQNTARHYREKAAEAKELLLAMARAAESVGTRDRRCAGQINEVTTRLKAIASLDDLTEMRASIEKSAAELKTSIDRMTAEGKAAVDELQKQVSTYQARMEEAEEIASRDSLTGMRSRLWVENLMESRMAMGSLFCVAMLDINRFKNVNDKHGHLTGDELLKQFAGELSSACRSTDVIGRWGGDEFVILLDCGLQEASAQIDRVWKWVCGDYTVQGPAGAMKLKIGVSIGLAECIRGESMTSLLARADAAMYERKKFESPAVS